MDSIVDVLFKQGGLIQFIVLIVPGYIAWQTSQLRRPQGEQKPADAILTILTFSVVDRFVWYGGIWSTWPSTFVQAATLVGQVFVTPILLALAVQMVLDFCASKFWIMSPYPRAWDFIFTCLAQRKEGIGSNGLFLIATLSDGSKVGGVYSDPGFASLWPYDRDVLIGKAWELEDGKPVREVDGSIGLYVSASSIQTLEVINYAAVVQSAIEGADGGNQDG